MIPAATTSVLWTDGVLATALFAIDPAGLGGAVLRSPCGPARDRWLERLKSLLPLDAPVRRIPLHIEDSRLLGGLDLGASLAAGRPIAQRGVLSETDGGIAILPMAERLETAAAARFAAALDEGEVVMERDGLARRLPARIGLVLLDEGVEPDERPPTALIERLAFHLAPDDGSSAEPACGRLVADVNAARLRLAGVAPPALSIVEAVCVTASKMGIGSLRAPLFALRAARAHAALQGRVAITNEDAAVAVRLVLAPRALTAPADAQPDTSQDDPPDPSADPPPPADDGDTVNLSSETDMAVEAIMSALPEDILAGIDLAKPDRKSAARSGAGAATRSARRGRPLGSRGGPAPSGARLNLIETLRAAAPWQRLRESASSAPRIQLRREDFRYRRFVERKQSTTIFVVDASGSTALQRLAEAKGAVELLLAQAYVSRASVALIAFRGARADVLLAPTRSLTRAKKELAGLPGGGGTPLAMGIEAALGVARSETAKGQTPFLVFLTDGRANVGRDGAPGRAAAEHDALAASRQVAEALVQAAYLDTAPRAQPDGDRFARAMGATYAPLPYVDASAVFDLVSGMRAGRA